MEKLKDILNSVKERFTNPLFFSFFFAWTFFNWEIVVSLAWYDTEQIGKEGYKSIFAFIADKLDASHSFWFPMGMAVLYTLFMPLIRNLTRALYSWFNKWGDNWNIRILKGSNIPIDKYFKLRDDYNKRTAILEDAIKNESNYLMELNSIRTELITAQQSNKAHELQAIKMKIM